MIRARRHPPALHDHGQCTPARQRNIWWASLSQGCTPVPPCGMWCGVEGRSDNRVINRDDMALSDLIMSLSALIPYPPTEENKITFPCQMFFATKRLHMEALGPSISAFCVIFRCASFRTGHLVGNHSFDKTMFYLHNTPHSKNYGREQNEDMSYIGSMNLFSDCSAFFRFMQLHFL